MSCCVIPVPCISCESHVLNVTSMTMTHKLDLQIKQAELFFSGEHRCSRSDESHSHGEPAAHHGPGQLPWALSLL